MSHLCAFKADLWIPASKMRAIIFIVLLVVCVPAAYIGVMSLFGVAIENRKALWMAAVMVAAIILFAGLTTWH